MYLCIYRTDTIQYRYPIKLMCKSIWYTNRYRAWKPVRNQVLSIANSWDNFSKYQKSFKCFKEFLNSQLFLASFGQISTISIKATFSSQTEFWQEYIGTNILQFLDPELYIRLAFNIFQWTISKPEFYNTCVIALALSWMLFRQSELCSIWNKYRITTV